VVWNLVCHIPRTIQVNITELVRYEVEVDETNPVPAVFSVNAEARAMELRRFTHMTTVVKMIIMMIIFVRQRA
jgi:hypothetical protein